MVEVARVGAVSLALLAGTACNTPDWSAPEKAYLSLARAVQKGELNLAWSALSERSRTALEQRARAIADASGGAFESDAQMLFFRSGAQPSPLGKVDVVRQEGDAALLVVTSAEGTPREVRMVREEGKWKLDVSEALKD